LKPCLFNFGYMAWFYLPVIALRSADRFVSLLLTGILFII
jgi:hypothetical protein